jgi:type IV secretory pathway VirB10-like protein
MLPPPQQTTLTPPMSQASQPPSRLAQWSKDEYMKALSAPPMIATFHKGQTQEIPSVTNPQTSTVPSLNPYQPATSTPGHLHPPESPYLITAGSVIPAVLIDGINSDLPGPILAQVRENVFDTATGRWILLPHGTKLIGNYKNDASYGQQRIQISWKRLVFPNASSMDLPDMPGADAAGYAGFNDQVNNHYAKTFGTAALMSVISAGQMIGQMGAFGGGGGFLGPYGYGYTQPNQWAMLSEMGGASASQQLGQVGQNSIQRGINIPPTLEIRPGYEFNVMVTTDLVLPSPYRG